MAPAPSTTTTGSKEEPPQKKKRSAGLSFDEKKERTARYLRGARDIFQLKELETLLPKHEKVVSQAVREVVDTLVAEGVVCCEKVGSSNYYWAFPSDAVARSRGKRDDALNELSELKDGLKKIKIATEKKEKEVEARDRCAPEDYRKALKDRSDAEDALMALESEVAHLKAASADVVRAKRDALKVAEGACARWTDNLDSLQAFVARTSFVAREDFFKMLGIPLPKD